MISYPEVGAAHPSIPLERGMKMISSTSRANACLDCMWFKKKNLCDERLSDVSSEEIYDAKNFSAHMIHHHRSYS
jgi:hypothetical protein